MKIEWLCRTAFLLLLLSKGAPDVEVQLKSSGPNFAASKNFAYIEFIGVILIFSTWRSPP